MKKFSPVNLCWLFCLAFLFSGCTSTRIKESETGNNVAYQYRAEKLEAITDWGLRGRISLDDGDQGGSGTLQWQVIAGRSELDFHAVMGRGAWHLEIGPDGALLTEADGTEQAAMSVDTLVQERLGWKLPVDALHWWVRGLTAPGKVELKELDDEGLLTSLHQYGWTVEFKSYHSKSSVPLPKRLNATQDDYRVKLLVRNWQMDVSDVGEN